MLRTRILRRLVSAAFTLVLISIISFLVIQLPPGDVVSNWIKQQEIVSGSSLPPATIDMLRERYGFGEPMVVQYLKWVGGFFRGDFGFSVIYDEAPVAEIVGRRIGMTFLLVVLALIVSWGLAIPLGIYAATHKNQAADYIMSNVALFGLSIPDFLMAVVYLFIAVFLLDSNYTGGLFSDAYVNAQWSAARLWDFLKHLAVPLFILSIGGMAGTYRIMRANLLDLLDQQFVETARAKGLRERAVIYRHAARIAINPLISRLGMQLPVLLNGTIIISIVLDLPTLGPPFYRALIAQDMFLAGTVLMILAVTLLVGNVIADILLAWSDPRGCAMVETGTTPRLGGGQRQAAPKPEAADDYRLLSVRQLMWRKFLRNRLAVFSAGVLVVLYLATIFAGFVAPYGPQDGVSRLSYAPPTRVRFCDEAGCSLRPFVYAQASERNMTTFMLEIVEDTSERHHIYFFEHGASYRILGLIPGTLHLFGTRSDDARVSLMGNDQRGRDLFSRIIYGSQVTLSVGLVGVAIMVALGSVIGTLSGYFGGWFDNVVQRFIETLRVFPEIPLWMALSAGDPADLAAGMGLCGHRRGAGLPRLDGARARGARPDADAQEARLRPGGRGLGRDHRTDRPQAPDPQHDEPHHRHRDAGGADHDPRGIGAVLPRHRRAASDDELGAAALGRLQGTGDRALSLDAVPRRLHPGDGAGLQLPGRRAARHGGPVLVSVLSVRDLHTHYHVEQGLLRAVDGVSFDIAAGETLGIVGESGCGKSVTARSIMRLLPARVGEIAGGEIVFAGRDGTVDIAALKPNDPRMRAIRGGEIGMIFQEPMTSLNPVHRIGDQIVEAIRTHSDVTRAEAWDRAVRLLDRVGINDPQARAKQYPHAFSGGMRQRAMIAMALSSDPRLLIADEPTTAVDVTVEAQILALIEELQDERDMAVMLITHDLNVVGEIADRVVVMYLGRVMEVTQADTVFDAPAHPYTQGLLASLPLIGRRDRLSPIEGSVPGPHERPPGCPFAPRCPQAMPKCAQMPPMFDVGPGTRAACWLHDGAGHE